jgi:hypothetical protein
MRLTLQVIGAAALLIVGMQAGRSRAASAPERTSGLAFALALHE